jgi:hypothetical protein
MIAVATKASNRKDREEYAGNAEKKSLFAFSAVQRFVAALQTKLGDLSTQQYDADRIL